MTEPSLADRMASLVHETLSRNTDTMIARYFAEHPEVPVNDVVLYLDQSQAPAMMFRVERRAVLEELVRANPEKFKEIRCKRLHFLPQFFVSVYKKKN